MKTLPFGKPIIGDEEREAVLRVLHGSQLVHGPEAHKFEEDFKKFVGGGYAQSVSSCTAGLHLAYIYLGVGPTDVELKYFRFHGFRESIGQVDFSIDFANADEALRDVVLDPQLIDFNVLDLTDALPLGYSLCR